MSSRRKPLFLYTKDFNFGEGEITAIRKAGYEPLLVPKISDYRIIEIAETVPTNDIAKTMLEHAVANNMDGTLAIVLKKVIKQRMEKTHE